MMMGCLVLLQFGPLEEEPYHFSLEYAVQCMHAYGVCNHLQYSVARLGVENSVEDALTLSSYCQAVHPSSMSCSSPPQRPPCCIPESQRTPNLSVVSAWSLCVWGSLNRVPPVCLRIWTTCSTGQIRRNGFSVCCVPVLVPPTSASTKTNQLVAVHGSCTQKLGGRGFWSMTSACFRP